jgi:protein O-mannosyl-transferase
MRRDWIICLALAAITIAIYWRATDFPFISYDDRDYVYDNPHVNQGFSTRNIMWAFTTGHAANWHPLTWLSHMLDAQLFGNDAGKYHLVNILLHAANAALLYLVLARLTSTTWPSAIVGALFALHPLHVESVAWVAERKDVLSTFFMLLAILVYERFARTHRRHWAVAVACLFAGGLLAKPMVITLPALLLLLDYWPLQRLSKRAIREKVPLLALAGASAIITLLVQRAGGATRGLEQSGLWLRISNAIVSLVRYLGKTFWPLDLAVFYPLPDHWPLWLVAMCTALVILITASVFFMRRTMPWLLVGWLWYLIALAPVIGIIQVGDQAMADRYTYIPLVGIFIMIVWSIRAAARESMAPALATASAVVLVILSILTYRQLGYWRSSETLFRHAAQVTPNNWLAYNHLATALADERRFPEALEAAQRAVALHPSGITHFNLANLLRALGQFEPARRQYKEAIAANPRLVEARNNLGVTLLQLQRPADAEAFFREATQMKPDYADAHANLGTALLQQNKAAAARESFLRALQIVPTHSLAQRGLDQADQMLDRSPQ